MTNGLYAWLTTCLVVLPLPTGALTRRRQEQAMGSAGE
jgi:hypothetical protein